MPIPPITLDPPFNITRASHAVLTARDLEASRTFYTEVVGLMVTDEDHDTVYLRGVEEIAHHSLVLKRARDEAVCERTGLRVFTEEDLEKAKHFFDAKGLPAEWVEVPHQGRTLHVVDPLGMPLELCATMTTLPRLHVQHQLHKGACALRYDHVQFLVPVVQEACDFYSELGFRTSDYMTERDDPDGRLLAVFLYRKNNPHDLVFLTRPGPRMHHIAYVVAESSHLFRACDIAANVGFGRSVERGPARHGQGHQLYVYFRDPDGHRIEILPPPIQIIDIDDTPVHWKGPVRFSWELPPPKKWLFEASLFPGVELREPPVAMKPVSLEDFLADAK